jgi:hypothetical protein
MIEIGLIRSAALVLDTATKRRSRLVQAADEPPDQDGGVWSKQRL